jgi:hypothetical protein
MKVQGTGGGLYQVANSKPVCTVKRYKAGQEGNFMLDNKLFTSLEHSCCSLQFADKVR